MIGVGPAARSCCYSGSSVTAVDGTHFTWPKLLNSQKMFGENLLSMTVIKLSWFWFLFINTDTHTHTHMILYHTHIRYNISNRKSCSEYHSSTRNKQVFWLQQCQFFCLSIDTKSGLLKIQKQDPTWGCSESYWDIRWCPKQNKLSLDWALAAVSPNLMCCVMWVTEVFLKILQTLAEIGTYKSRLYRSKLWAEWTQG